MCCDKLPILYICSIFDPRFFFSLYSPNIKVGKYDTKYIISYSLLAGTKVNIVNLYTVDDIREWLKDPVNVYIGRQTRLISGSKWGNPYRMIDYEDNREVVIDLYEMYLAENPDLLNSVGELRDKVLGCWCSPQACHGEILHRLAGNHPVYASKE